ncbi:hypothetical protein ACFZCP_44245 [Streptomyces sp. NPDC007971]|uniref:hypothetical protein n=1 Tax=Streptomyces sp. NPDC007971 TaxID=3364799 RepID=UPI0036E9811A
MDTRNGVRRAAAEAAAVVKPRVQRVSTRSSTQVFFAGRRLSDHFRMISVRLGSSCGFPRLTWAHHCSGGQGGTVPS